MADRSNPAVRGVAVVPDVAFADGVCRALWVGVTGNVTCVMTGVAVTFVAVPVGILPVACTRVNNTGTTASSIVALY